jgi:hypothetical protein
MTAVNATRKLSGSTPGANARILNLSRALDATSIAKWDLPYDY